MANMISALAGNREIKQTVESIVRSGRFPHAFIIEGEKGSGRRTLAGIIAAAAICEAEDAPCGHCRSCELAAKNGHCDILTYAPDGATFKIDTVRSIRDSAFIMPIEASRKVNILLDCDKMNEPAQNAFLKVLEEPPEFMVFILITESAASLLTTVRSRCVTLTLSNPEPSEALGLIRERRDGGEVGDEQIMQALDESHGNVGKALDILSGTAAAALTAASDYITAVIKRDRLGALKILLPFEKDRVGFSAFLSELRRATAYEARLCAEGKGRLTVSVAARLLRAAEDKETLFRRHIGQPLSIQIASTALTAEIMESIS